MISLMPELQDQLSVQPEGSALTAEQMKEQSQVSQLIANSTLIRSYEQTIAMYRAELDKKGAELAQTDQAQEHIIRENSELTAQVHVLRGKFGADGAALAGDEERLRRIENEQLLDMLKRNHDVLLEKHDLVKRRNDQLERTSAQREQQYEDLKLEHDRAADQLHRSQSELTEKTRALEMLGKRLKDSSAQAKTAEDQLQSLRGDKDRFEGRNKVLEEQLRSVQRSLEDTIQAKGTELDLLMKELTQVGIREKDAKQSLQWAEKETSELRDQVRTINSELDTRTAENDHLISLLEEHESRLATYEAERGKITTLANESRKRIEEANLERDKVALKEAQYLREIERRETMLTEEAKRRQERHERVLEAVRESHRATVESRDDEITELKLKLGDALDGQERLKVESESLQRQLDKVLEQWKSFKEDANAKYESYARQINQAELKNEEHNRALITECEKQRDECEAMRAERQTTKIELSELHVKLDSYMRDYERFFDENKRLREHVNLIRDEKDTAISELNRLKVIYHERVNELTDECNIKIAQLENQLLEVKERHRHAEGGAYEVMAQQEKMVSKWKNEHKETRSFFEKKLGGLETENGMLKEK